MGPRTVNGKEGSFITAIRESSNLEGESKDTSPQARRNNVATALLIVLERRRAVEGTFPSATPVK